MSAFVNNNAKQLREIAHSDDATAEGSKYPPAKPEALLCEPLKAAKWGANATPDFLRHLAVATQHHGFN